MILAMAMTVLHIMLAAALPVWSHELRREKEEELIFRGLQYAEAIRVFQQQFNRLPVRLEELVEVEPRSIRQLWLNPMSEDGSWGLIVGGLPPGSAPGGRNPGGAGGPAGGARPAPGAPGGVVLRGGGIDARSGQPQLGKPTATGPIQGVYSPEGGAAIKSFFGSKEISEWRFTPELLRPGAPPPGSPGSGIGPFPVNAAFVGRPFPPGVVPPNAPSAEPDATGAGGAPGGTPGRPAPRPAPRG